MRIESAERLGGGAAHETWKVAVAHAGRGEARRHLRVVRENPPADSQRGLSPADEFAVLCATHEAGVLVPRPLALCEDTRVLGASFFVTEHVPGAGEGASLPPGSREEIRDYGHARSRPGMTGRTIQRVRRTDSAFARQLGRELAKLHRITAQRCRLSLCGQPPGDSPSDRFVALRGRLDALGDPQPVLEWAIRQLERKAPDSTDAVLCHGAPDGGHCLVGDGELLAILDWSASRWGDRWEDIGYFCSTVRHPVSLFPEEEGEASRRACLESYREFSGLGIDDDSVHYWEVMAMLGRAVDALEQGHRFVADGERSIELALRGRRVAEVEIALLAETDRLAMERAHA